MTPSTYPWIEELGLHDTLDAIASSGRGVLFGHPAEARDLTRRVLSRVPCTSEDLEAHRQILGVQLPKRQREALAVGLERELVDFISGSPQAGSLLRSKDRWRALKDLGPWPRVSSRKSQPTSSVADVVAALLAADNGQRSRWLAAVALHFDGQYRAASGLHRSVADMAQSMRTKFYATLNRLGSLARAREYGVLRRLVPSVDAVLDVAIDEQYDWLMCVVIYGSERQCEEAMQFVVDAKDQAWSRWLEIHLAKRPVRAESSGLIRPDMGVEAKMRTPRRVQLAGSLIEVGVL